MTQIEDIALTQIVTGNRLRPVDPAWAQALADNITETGGLRQPIEVRALADGRFALIAGMHRLAAARLLGWPTIPAQVLDLTADHARLREIDENLVRHELNPLDRAVFLAERKALYEKLNPHTRHGAQGGRGGKRNESEIVSFSKDTADRVGLTTRTIQLAVSIATRLAPDVRAAIAGTWIAKTQKDLLDLSKLGPGQQRAAIGLLLADDAPVTSVRQAADRLTGRVKTPPDGFERLLAAWRQAGRPERRQFLAHLQVTADALAALGFAVVPVAPATEATADDQPDDEGSEA